MKRNYTGCAICDSTWGDVFGEIDGERVFFCCAICETQFRALVDRIRSDTGWPRIDTIEISGDRRGRTCRAAYGSSRIDATFAFRTDGALRKFRRTDAAEGPAPSGRPT